MTAPNGTDGTATAPDANAGQTDATDAAALAADAADSAMDEQDTDWQAEATKWKTLARKHEANAKSNADAARELKTRKDAELSDIQRAEQKATDAEQRATVAEARALRSELAVEFELPAKWAARIAGTTVEELRESAEALRADLDELRGEQQQSAAPVRPANLAQGARQTSRPPESADDWIRRAAGHW